MSVKSPSYKRLLFGGMLICLSISGGCQPSHEPTRVAVNGTVTLDGQPLPSATLIMQPNGQGLPMASALVQDGRFQFTTNDGPSVGTYLVRVEATYPEFEKFAEDPKSFPSVQRPPIAKRFTEFGTLTANVTPGGIEPQVFEVKSQ